MITQAAEDAARLATRSTPGWWEERVRSEFRYTLFRVQSGADPTLEWPRLERRLNTLCRTHERNEGT